MCCRLLDRTGRWALPRAPPPPKPATSFLKARYLRWQTRAAPHRTSTSGGTTCRYRRKPGYQLSEHGVWGHPALADAADAVVIPKLNLTMTFDFRSYRYPAACNWNSSA